MLPTKFDSFGKSNFAGLVIVSSPVRNISDGAHLISKMIVILNKFLKNPKNFLAHLAKGNVSFCHHLVSVVR
jgi:hypothetical protein